MEIDDEGLRILNELLESMRDVLVEHDERITKAEGRLDALAKRVVTVEGKVRNGA